RADAEVEIATRVVAREETAAAFNVDEGRFVKIGCAAEQIPYSPCDRLFGARGRLARRQRVGGSELRQSGVPSRRQLAGQHRLELGRFRRMLFCVALE